MVHVHGYDFADRPLEGVMIEIRIIDGKFSARVQPGDLEYFDSARLSVAKVQADAAEFANDLDVATCPTCGEDVEMPKLEPQEPRPEPMTLTLTHGSALAAMLTKAKGKKKGAIE